MKTSEKNDYQIMIKWIPGQIIAHSVCFGSYERTTYNHVNTNVINHGSLSW